MQSSHAEILYSYSPYYRCLEWRRDTDGEKSLSSPESDKEDSSYQDPNTKTQESEDDSAHVKVSTGQSADKTSIGETEEDGEDADAAGVDGDDDFQKSTNPELTARKKEFYKEVDKRMEQYGQGDNPYSIMTDDYFDKIVKFMLSLEPANDKDRLVIMRTYPNKIAYKWVKRYDIKVVQNSNILFFKQPEGSPLDLCQQVIKYSNVFDAIREIHELQIGNDHPKAKTLYKRVNAKYGRSIPCWVCEIFPNYCPVCIRAKTRCKAKAGHQPLLTRGMNAHAQMDLIDYQSMPDFISLCLSLPGSWNQVLSASPLTEWYSYSSGT